MKEILDFNKGLFDFLAQSPTPFHTTVNIKNRLVDSGFIELSEKQKWQLSDGKGYFVIRDSGSIIAFTLGSNETPRDGFRIIGAHTDSPSLQLKPQPVIKKGNNISLGVEVYGGPLLNTWFDRDLSVAGRVLVNDQSGQIKEVLIDFRKPFITIPSLAIHLDREANGKRSINAQKDLPTLFTKIIEDQSIDVVEICSKHISTQYPNIDFEEILSFDLFCYDTQAPTYTGLNQDFISASRLDNLVSCYAGLTALTENGFETNTFLLCYNHEEVGSDTINGAQSTFIESVFERIIPEIEERRIAFANSFNISMDNAHATHPNNAGKSDPQHPIELNEGVVLKINAKQRYASNGYSSSIFKQISKNADIKTQDFVMRSDMPSGSTIGSITASKLGVSTVDVGVPSLAMHSIREVTGFRDPFDLFQLGSEFFRSSVHRNVA